MKIDKVNISNFKNYNGNITFDLSKQVTILHGDNGFGKSTFFDAIEWCLTNKIDRFEGKDREIKQDIINRNCSFDKFQVSVCIEFGGNMLTRSFNVTSGESGNTLVEIKEMNGQIHKGQTNVENFLKSKQYKDTDFGRGAYGQLIKQTYMLSQDQVTEFVTSEDSAERYRALANIMGLRSMLNEIDNMKKILSALKVKDREVENELTQYDESIKSKIEAKNTVDIYDVNNKLAQIGIKDLQGDVEKQCEELKSQMLYAKNKSNDFLKLYEKLQLNNHGSIAEMMNEIVLKENKRKDQQIKFLKRESLLIQIQDRIKGFKKEKKDLYKYNRIRSEISKNETKLLGLGIEGNNIDVISREIDSFRGSASKIEYQISVRQSLLQNFNRIEEMDKENKLIRPKTSHIEYWFTSSIF